MTRERFGVGLRLQGGITAIGRSIRRALADDYKLPQLRAEIPDRTVLMIG
jgi:hypothetical protein